MRILVTGGGGFIGKALARRLAGDGFRVFSLSREDYPVLREYGIETIQADLCDREAIIKAIRGIDIVFHVAALAGYWGPYSDYYRTNVTGTRNVIDACTINGVGCLVFTSSASVVFSGQDIEGGDESLKYPAQPISHYTATKALAERDVLKANHSQMKTISLRPHLVWGPGDRHLLPGVIAQARNGKLKMIGNGENIVDTVYIDNVVDAHIRVLKLPENSSAWGKPFFITNGQPVKLWNLINELLTISGIDPVGKSLSRSSAMKAAIFLEFFHRVFRNKVPPRLSPFIVHELAASHWFNIDAARELLGYQPVITIEEGLILMGK